MCYEQKLGPKVVTICHIGFKATLELRNGDYSYRIVIGSNQENEANVDRRSSRRMYRYQRY